MDTERAKQKYDRLSKDEAALLIIDHQSGLFQLVHDNSPVVFEQNVCALADIAKLFKLPVVVTTSKEDGPNGPLMPVLRERLPKTQIIRREGEINAWDNNEFVKAVKKTGRKQLIIAGITTDVCVAFAALSAIEAGYKVYVVTDASGSLCLSSTGPAIARMVMAGAQPMSWFAVASELLRDWRDDESGGFKKLMTEHVPNYRHLIDSHETKKQED
ncbi:Nicotinamidase-related amidase [Nannocystis exedens]|uniref:Nicotinamidase-related amidase n=1 Tax=Nannocystis exedens TaxID=54 RepID=A0A1I2HS69_9BACT|nr:hydrolase [Nannocystis exedens]PCC69363.1 hydrolase [Nannocystis exedens]SFF31221.1 Nicotinamidase-related amidase [Nannocystis exedens]